MKFSLDLITHALRYVHPEKLYSYFGLPVPNNASGVAARAFGVSALLYLPARQAVEHQARETAQQLLDIRSVAAQVDQLPFQPGDLVAAVGDSITDDLLSWFHLLQNMVNLRRRRDHIRFLNTAFSGDTTAHLLSRFVAVVQAQPQWVLCLAGTNDARRHGELALKTDVSLEETLKNLTAMQHYARSQAPCRWLWLTPNPIRQEQVVQDEYFHQSGITWQCSDLDAVAEAIRRHFEPVIDLYPVFGYPPDAYLLEEDGLHPSSAGQVKIVRAVLDHFSSRKSGI
jgi:acyl-CoA thioesterase I